MPHISTAAAELTARCVRPGDALVRVHLIEPLPGPYRTGSVRRAGGAPIGVDEDTRPRRPDGFLAHLLTVDLDDVPRLRAVADLAGVRALALFGAGPREVALVRLGEDDLAKGEWTGPPVADPPARAYQVHPLDVPARVFYDVGDLAFDEDAVDPALEDLHDLLASAARIGGPLLHRSGDRDPKDFLLQYDVDLGGPGTVYVHATTAYRRPH